VPITVLPRGRLLLPLDHVRPSIRHREEEVIYRSLAGRSRLSTCLRAGLWLSIMISVKKSSAPSSALGYDLP